MKFSTAFLCSLILFIALSCKMRNHNESALPQGVFGRVIVSEGNMMPGPDKKQTHQKGFPATVLIYGVATAGQAVGQGPLYTAVNRPLIAKIKTDSAGFFRCKLKPGSYSVFTLEKGKYLFASLSNEKGEIAPISIIANQFLEYNIEVNYKAVY